MNREILSLSKKLISIQSISTKPLELTQVLDEALSVLQEYTIERFEKNGVKSALVYNVSKRPKKFKILLNAHLDVIPGKDYQYIPKIKNNKLYGAGALDMKSNAAVIILIFKEVAKKLSYPIALQLVTDEELGGFNGTKYQIDKGVRAEFVISGETTNFDIVNKTKGILLVKISCKGKTAHGAYPWRGDNAIWKMNKFLNSLEKQFHVPKKEQWITTVNLSRIETTNNSFNKIPDDCKIWLDIRYVPNDADIVLSTIKKILPKGFRLEIFTKEPARSVTENDPYLEILKKISEQTINKKIILRGAHGTSDARHFTKVNCDGIEFGAIGNGIGSDNEWIDIKSLTLYYEILKKFLLSVN